MKNQSILGEINPDTKIYRIMPRCYFFEIFEKRENTLVRPIMWKDPFENVFLNSPVVSSDGTIGRFEFFQDIYAQCWTLDSASNAMWEIYSRNQDAIRIRTTVGKLVESLRVENGNWADTTCFIGRVKYQSVKELKKFGKNMFKWYDNAEGIAQSLLLKRKEFQYEKEVRLIYISPSNTAKEKCMYKYDLDPLHIVDQVMVDGRNLQKQDFLRKQKKEIRSRTGLSLTNIHRSSFYDPPKGFEVHVY